MESRTQTVITPLKTKFDMSIIYFQTMAFVFFCQLLIAQPIEYSGIILYEHHGACCPGMRGDSSAWDFVNHRYINAVEPLGSHPNRDMVEHNGLVTTKLPFGFTSAESSIWGGSFAGNKSTKYCQLSEFDYDSATLETVITSFNSEQARFNVDSVSEGDIFIARIRNLELYALIKIIGINVRSPNDFQFDYKYFDKASSSFDLNSHAFKISPNPVTHNLQIDLEDIRQRISITILNMLGNIIFQEVYHNSNRIDLRLESLNIISGSYFLRIDSGNISSFSKFVKI